MRVWSLFIVIVLEVILLLSTPSTDSSSTNVGGMAVVVAFQTVSTIRRGVIPQSNPHRCCNNPQLQRKNDNSRISSSSLSFLSSIPPISFIVSHNRGIRSRMESSRSSSTTNSIIEEEGWLINVDMPPTGSERTAQMKIRPILSVPSELVLVRYTVPFNLNLLPQRGLAVCSGNGRGGERFGDILRFTSAWKLGVPKGDSILSTAVTVAGGVSWQCIMFDVMKANSWEEVVDALKSNTEARTDEVVLLFERALQWPPPELR